MYSRFLKHPENKSFFCLVHTGVYRTLRPMGPLDAPQEIDGIALETLFLQELIAHNSSLNLGNFLLAYFQRAGGGLCSIWSTGSTGI